MKIRALLINTALALASVVLSFFAADYLFGVMNPQWTGDYKFPIRKTDQSYLFELIPGVAGHSSLNLRNPEITIKKPDDVFRIVILGDSVTYGLYVDAAKAYPALIGNMLADKKIQGRRIEVINAGVPAYTTYNELQFYKDKLKQLSPDLLILGFCMNDVVDPFFHWSDMKQPDLSIPETAVPDKAYHDRQILNDRNLLLDLMPDSSNIKRFFNVRKLTNQTLATSKTRTDGQSYPVYLALEQPLTIDVYNDYESPQWQWLRRQVKELSQSLKADHTDFLFVIFPLSYQLDRNYPFSPTANFERFCGELGLDCLDTLDALKGQPVNDLFQSGRSGFNDIWHFTAKGHEKVAAEIVEKKIKPRLDASL